MNHPSMLYTSLNNSEKNDTHISIDGSTHSTRSSQNETLLNEDAECNCIDPLIHDPFVPFDNLPAESENILTFRAIAIGVICGSLVNASNIYLGLKSGWGMSANLFASIVGFSLLKSTPNFLRHVPFLGDDFGPRENNIVQTAATAAGGMSNVFTSAFPAMYQLGLLDNPINDFWRLVSLTAVGGYFGLFFATPLRKFFTIVVARDLNLIFPTPTATAVTIRDMHDAANSADESTIARRKMKFLMTAFLLAIALRVLSEYLPGILWDWHPFTWYLFFVPSSTVAIGLESWGWFIELSPAFIGTGMLVGLNVAVSYFLGCVLAWGIIGPILVSSGLASGTAIAQTGLMSYHDISHVTMQGNSPSPRYWLLWPGVACLLASSFTELACQWRAFWILGRACWRHITRVAAYLFLSHERRSEEARKQSRKAQEDSNSGSKMAKDPAPSEQQVKTWMWLPGLLITIAIGCLVLQFQYGMPVRETCLAFTLAFVFSCLTIQATGATDITPLSAASASSQVVLGAEASRQSWPAAQAQQLSLLGGALSVIGASQAADLTSDFRVGFLLRTSPYQQWLAQAIGTAFATVIAPSIYVLFATAYPCINQHDEQCAFSVPSASYWRAIALTTTASTSQNSSSNAIPSITPSSLHFSIGISLVAVASVLIRHNLWHGRRAWIKAYHPNMTVVALGFIIPATIYGTAILTGAVIAAVWARSNRAGFEALGFAVAAGGIAGEGIGGVVNAALQIAGLGGDRFGIGLGCPAGVC